MSSAAGQQNPEPRQKTHLFHLFVILLSGVTGFLVVPTFMIGFSPLSYAHLNITLVYETGALLAVLYTGTLTAGYALLNLARLPLLASLLVYFCFSFTLLTGLLLPTTGTAGMVSPEQAPLNPVNLSIALLMSLAIAWLCQTRHKSIVLVGTGVFLLSSMATSLPAIINGSFYSESEQLGREFASLSPKRNIITLSMDGIPGQLAADMIRKEPRFREAFKDFQFYEEAVSPSPATTSSITGELYGAIYLRDHGKTENDLRSNLPRERLLINQPEIDLYTYGVYNTYQLHPERKVFGLAKSSVMQQQSDVDDLFQYVIARLATPFSLKLLNQARGKEQESAAESDRLEERFAGMGQKSDDLSAKDFKRFKHQLSLNGEDLSIRYMHFTFTHFPVNFDINCDKRSDDRQWYRSHQNLKGITDETICALDELSGILEALKTIGVYDKTLLILKSDHGKPATYFENPPDNLQINNNPLWGYNRYRPMLMIKPEGQQQQTINFISSTVSLNDLAKTLCIAAGVQPDCDVFPGVDLLGTENLGGDDFYIYIPENKRSSHRFDDHQPLKISRGKPLVRSLQEAGVVAFPENDNHQQNNLQNNAQQGIESDVNQ